MNSRKLLEGAGDYARARKALPILVRQAIAEQTIAYQDLARELGLTNQRHVGRVLGKVGHALEALSDEWDKEIPHIMGLVVRKDTGIPGEGFSWFLENRSAFLRASPRRKKAIIDRELSIIFCYKAWSRVLDHFGLSVATRPLRAQAVPGRGAGRGGGPETEAHRRFKRFVAHHPELFDVSKAARPGIIEYCLPSGDEVDVLFQHRNHWVGIEAKAATAPLVEIERGLFQCVKYAALMAAAQAAQQRRQSYRVVLCTEGRFPPELEWLRHTLGISVVSAPR
jgi:hypothetical protein